MKYEITIKEERTQSNSGKTFVIDCSWSDHADEAGQGCPGKTDSWHQGSALDTTQSPWEEGPGRQLILHLRDACKPVLATAERAAAASFLKHLSPDPGLRVELVFSYKSKNCTLASRQWYITDTLVCRAPGRETSSLSLTVVCA